MPRHSAEEIPSIYEEARKRSLPRTQVNTSRDVKIAGAIGPCASMEAKGVQVADVSVGIGGTTAWKMCGLNNSTTLATFYEIVPATQGGGAQGGAQAGTQAAQQFFLQFLTQ